MGNVQGMQAVPRAELMALVVLTDNINAAVLFEVRVASSSQKMEAGAHDVLRDAGSGRCVEAHTCHVPSAVTEMSSDDEDPLVYGGALEANEDSCAFGLRSIESPVLRRVERLVLGRGVVHDSHEANGGCGASLSVRSVAHGARRHQNCWPRLARDCFAPKPQDGVALQHACLAKACVDGDS